MPGAILLGLLCALAACGRGDPDSGVKHVVVVVLDATHAGHLGSYGGSPLTTPRLDALAARAVRFGNAFSTTTWTLPSTVSLLTGLRPERHGVVTANHLVPQDQVLLAERLEAAGVTTSGLSQMVFASPRHRIDQGFSSFRYAGPRDGPELEALHDDARAWASSPGETPSFLYLHLRRPHSPYAPTPEHLAAVGCTCDGADDDAWSRLRFLDSQEPDDLSEAERDHVRHLYQGNLHEVDARLGEILELLEPALERDTLLIVTSDHGEALGEHGPFGHGAGLWSEQVRIPLLLAGPGLGARVVDTPVSTVDLLPTVLEALGLPLPDDLDGRSLMPLARGGRAAPRVVLLSARRYPGHLPAVGAVGPTLKLVQETDGTLRAHRWARDPLERQPVPAARWARDERKALLSALVELRRVPTEDLPPLDLDPEAQQHLRELGYIR